MKTAMLATSLCLTFVSVSDATTEALAQQRKSQAKIEFNPDLEKQGVRFQWDAEGRIREVDAYNRPGNTNELLREVSRFRKIESLRLSYTNVDRRGLAHIADLPELRTLSLYHTPTGDEDLEEVAKMKSLERLDLMSTSVTDKGLAHLSGLSRLQMVWMPPATTDAGLAEIRDWKELRLLSLTHTKVTDAGLRHLGVFANLDDLHLMDTKIKGDGLIHLAECQKLHRILADTSEIGDDGIQHLATLKNLRILSASNVTHLGASRLAEKLPQLEISFSGGTIRPELRDAKQGKHKDQ